MCYNKDNIKGINNIQGGLKLKYKIVALDMDGTLLNEQKEITEETKNVLSEARNKGVKIVLSSGRPLDGLKNYLNELNLVDDNEFVLSYNGCLVQETKTSKIIHEVGLKGSDLKYMYNLSKKIGVNIHAFSPNIGLMSPKISKYTEVEANINKININIIDFNKINDNDDIVKVMMVDEPEILDEAIKKLPQSIYDKYTVVKSAPFFLEFINKNADKGKGLEALAKYLGVKREEIIAMGDAENDLAMIKYAGLGVAMGNAVEKVKEASDVVTLTNEQNGVAKIIKEYILNS